MRTEAFNCDSCRISINNEKERLRIRGFSDYESGDQELDLCWSCWRNMLTAIGLKHDWFGKVTAVGGESVKCSVYDTACIDPKYCAAAGACCAGDPQCGRVVSEPLCLNCRKPRAEHDRGNGDAPWFCTRSFWSDKHWLDGTVIEERTAEQIAAFVELCLDPPNETSRLLVDGIRSGAWRTSK